MNNTWENIEISDYENHMRHDSVLQLQCLCEIMNNQFFEYDINSIMILGVAGGNGLQLFNGKKHPTFMPLI